MFLIFVVITILFVLTCYRMVNRKRNFVLCQSYSHICYQISSTLHRPIIGLLRVTSLWVPYLQSLSPIIILTCLILFSFFVPVLSAKKQRQKFKRQNGKKDFYTLFIVVHLLHIFHSVFLSYLFLRFTFFFLNSFICAFLHSILIFLFSVLLN